MSSARLPVVKLNGAGNDFVFIDARRELQGSFGKVSRAELVRKICDRHYGVGADGLAFVEEQGGLFSWDFYNTDGSNAEMCGNATRCMGRWAKNHLGLEQISFKTEAGIVDVRTLGDRISSHLGFIKATLRTVSADIGGSVVQATLVNSGVPHLVVKIDDLDVAANQRELIGALRFHPSAGSRGANVTFLQIAGRGRLRTKSFERGVEGFTLSCGTGVIAAAAVCLKDQGGLRAEVWTPGGELVVEFGADFEGVTLIGPAIEVFEAELSEEILK